MALFHALIRNGLTKESTKKGNTVGIMVSISCFYLGDIWFSTGLRYLGCVIHRRVLEVPHLFLLRTSDWIKQIHPKSTTMTVPDPSIILHCLYFPSLSPDCFVILIGLEHPVSLCAPNGNLLKYSVLGLANKFLLSCYKNSGSFGSSAQTQLNC